MGAEFAMGFGDKGLQHCGDVLLTPSSTSTPDFTVYELVPNCFS